MDDSHSDNENTGEDADQFRRFEETLRRVLAAPKPPITKKSPPPKHA